MGWRFGFGLWRMVVDKWEKGGDLLGERVVEKFVGNEWSGLRFWCGFEEVFWSVFWCIFEVFLWRYFLDNFFEIRRIFKSVSKTTT